MEVTWPPTGEQAVLLDQLAEMIARGGAAHFLDAPVVRMDQRDFPEPWTATAAAVERLLARMFWHAYVDLEVAVDDLRDETHLGRLLKTSTISWIDTKDGVAEFQLETIGNDNVAGALSHEIGRAYLAWIAAATPYRDERPPPSDRDGTVAAIYLGLGVLAANAAEYRRTAGEIRGRTAVTEWDVVTTGGLATQEVLYLLAVQAVLRRGEIAAHATLRAELREKLRTAIFDLRPHRDALAATLGVELDEPRAPLERDPAPVTVTDDERPEPDRRQRFAGAQTYRVGEHHMWSRAALGAFTGGAAVIAMAAAGAAVTPLLGFGAVGAIGLIGGWIGRGTRVDRCYWGRCMRRLPPAATTCPGCGATIAGRIEDHRDELARRVEEEEERLDAIRIAAEREARGERGEDAERDDA